MCVRIFTNHLDKERRKHLGHKKEGKNKVRCAPTLENKNVILVTQRLLYAPTPIYLIHLHINSGELGFLYKKVGL